MEKNRYNYSKKQKNMTTRGNYSKYNHNTYQRKNVHAKKSHKFVNFMIFLVLVALSYVTINMLGLGISDDINSTVSKVFNSKFVSLIPAKDKVVSFVNNTASVFNGEKSDITSSNKELKLKMPVTGKVITKFSTTEHPVFNTSIKPRGIEIEVGRNAEVVASANGKVSNIVASSYGGNRVVTDVGNNKMVVYDGIKTTFVKVGDTIYKDNLIGTMDDNDKNVLGLEVWVDNTAVNPLSYMNTKSSNDTK